MVRVRGSVGFHSFAFSISQSRIDHLVQQRFDLIDSAREGELRFQSPAGGGDEAFAERVIIKQSAQRPSES